MLDAKALKSYLQLLLIRLQIFKIQRYNVHEVIMWNFYIK